MYEVKVCGNLSAHMALKEMKLGKIVRRFFNNKPEEFYKYGGNGIILKAETEGAASDNVWSVILIRAERAGLSFPGRTPILEFNQFLNSTFNVVTFQTHVRVIYE